MDTSNPIKYSALSESKREEISSFYRELQKLIEFNNKANQKLFVYLYGEQKGEHLWLKFRELNNMFLFLKYLDHENQTILLANIYGYDKMSFSANPLYAHCM